ncbi:ABC transporter permease [Candidatus Giovannonibacteria bacterium]|nr:ABC transporter permease [Candidatus Giovannonibacteria bacterium]
MNPIGFHTFIRQEIQRFMRVGNQTLFTPWITALLYIFIFGEIVGRRIGAISGVSYIDFVIPGLLMMNVMQAAFQQTSSSLYFQRFARHIEEILTAPLSYLEIIFGFVAAGILRGIIVGAGVYVLALLFTVTSVAHFWLFLFYAISVSLVFALAGLLVGLWAEDFERLSIPQAYVIMPLTFLGGLFNSIHMLPEKFQIFMRLNPFFYFVDGLRFSMIGVSESNRPVGVILIVLLILVLGFWVWYLFKRGYKIRT